MLIFFNDTATTEIYTLSLHDALPIFALHLGQGARTAGQQRRALLADDEEAALTVAHQHAIAIVLHDGGGKPRRMVRRGSFGQQDRKSTRLNSSHANISYAVFCLKKKI